MSEIQISDTCEIQITTPDKIYIETKTNGDRIILLPNLTKEQAATLAYLANQENTISVEFKVYTPPP